ncbi:MAG: globin domain-containing protein [Polyangiaceae bacterium]
MIDAHLLRETFEIVATRPRFGAEFYKRLFSSCPDLAPMFHRNSSGAQEKMFMQKLASIVDAVEDGAALRQALASVATSHVGYGVTPEMYARVGEVLLGTLADALDTEWTPEVETSWREAYAHVTELVLSASQK